MSRTHTTAQTVTEGAHSWTSACGTQVMIRTHTKSHTVTEGVKRHTLSLTTMHPQVQSDGGHYVTVVCAGTSTVGDCPVESLPAVCGRVETPQLGAYMRHARHDRTHTTAHTVTEGAKRHTPCLSEATSAAPRVFHMRHPHLNPHIHHVPTGPVRRKS